MYKGTGGVDPKSARKNRCHTRGSAAVACNGECGGVTVSSAATSRGHKWDKIAVTASVGRSRSERVGRGESEAAWKLSANKETGEEGRESGTMSRVRAADRKLARTTKTHTSKRKAQVVLRTRTRRLLCSTRK